MAGAGRTGSDLCGADGGAQAADGGGVRLRLLVDLEKQRGLFERLQGLLGATVGQLPVYQPVLQLPGVVPEARNSRTLTREDSSSYSSSPSSPAGPDLQAGAPGAHALPQQQVVERDGADDVIQLSDRLFDEVVVHAVLLHGGVEVVQVLQEDLHRDGLLLQEADAALPPARGLGGLGVQYACDYTCRER